MVAPGVTSGAADGIPGAPYEQVEGPPLLEPVE